MCKTSYLVLIISIVLSVPYASAQKKSEAPLSDLFSIRQTLKSSTFSKNVKAINKVFETEPRKIIVPLVFKEKVVNVHFTKQNLLHSDYKIMSAKGDKLSPNRPVFYSGIVAGQNNSMAYLAISKDDISLNIAVNGRNWSLTDFNPNAKSKQYMLSERIPSKKRNLFSCESSADDDESFKHSISKTISSADDGKVSIYFEADHHLFLQKGSSISAVETYIHSVFAQVALIYANENIDIEISEIKVWNIPDPYDVSSSQNALTSFRSALSGNFNGDLGHLLSGNSAHHGGKAYIDVLCDKSRAYAYSNVQGNYNGISNYTWDAFIISHEMGHNFGSHHTHDCVWGPNGDKALDDCGRTNEACDVIIPSLAVGTIMSYCHLDVAGISFALGFGDQPGNVIRSRYNACKANTGINCTTAIEITSNGKFKALGPVKGFGASQNNADHSNWFKFTAPSDGKNQNFQLCFRSGL